MINRIRTWWYSVKPAMPDTSETPSEEAREFFEPTFIKPDIVKDTTDVVDIDPVTVDTVGTPDNESLDVETSNDDDASDISDVVVEEDNTDTMTDFKDDMTPVDAPESFKRPPRALGPEATMEELRENLEVHKYVMEENAKGNIPRFNVDHLIKPLNSPDPDVQCKHADVRDIRDHLYRLLGDMKMTDLPSEVDTKPDPKIVVKDIPKPLKLQELYPDMKVIRFKRKKRTITRLS